jgi:hypothetical protein
MSIMQHINKRQLWFLIIVSGLFIGGRYLQQPASEKSAASKSVDELDAALLADLQTRQFQIEEQAACVMECNGIAASQLTALMQPENIDYSQCDFGNCHYTSYSIAGQLDNGVPVRFVVETGDGGDIIRAVEIDATCNC